MDPAHYHPRRLCRCIVCKPRDDVLKMPLVFPPTTWFGDDRKALVKEINMNFESLKLDVSEYGAEVKRTWSALKVKECGWILRRVGLRLPRRHRPEPGLYNALTKNSALDENTLRGMQKSFSFPYLTVEDLCYKDNLSLWLESRAKNAPASFAIFDLLQAGIPPFGHTSDPTDDMEGCAMIFPPHQPSKYGAVVHEDDLRNNDVGLPPDVGYAVLQLHKWLYEKPARLIKEILAFRGRLQARQSLHPLEHCAKRDTINKMELDQSPFLGPASVDTKFVEDIISSKCHAKLSHLLQIRESPAHLNTCVQDWTDNIAWTEDKHGERYKNHITAAALMVRDAKEQAWYWRAIEEKWAYLRRNEADSKSEGWLLAFQQLRDHLRSASHSICERMAESLPHAATFEPALEPVEDSDWSSFETTHNFRPKADASPILRRLYHLFSRFCSDDDRHIIRPYNISQEIDRLVKQEPEAYNLITPWLEQHFNDVASIQQVEHQFELWQPEASYALSMAKEAHLNNEKDAVFTYDWYTALGAYVDSHPLEPGSEVLRCPLEAAESIEVLKKQRDACDFVEAWWKGLDSALGWCTGSTIGKNGKKLPAVFAELMLRATKLDFPWRWAILKPAGQAHSKQGGWQVASGRRLGEGEVAKQAPVCNTDSPAETQDDPIEETAALSGVVSTGPGKLSIQTGADLQFTHSKSASTKNNRQSPKAKKQQKAIQRKKLSILAQQPKTLTETEPLLQPTRIIIDDTKAYATLEVIFGKIRLGQITFVEFRFAMQAAGFQSMQLLGSQWLFQYKDESLKPIVFHENHGTGDKKLGRIKLIDMARDLKERYGWELETFVLAEKK